MLEVILTALLIMALRIGDVSLGTMRMIMIVQAHKWLAALVGFFEVLIWVYAMKLIVNDLDQIQNLIFYAGGFALGNVVGITLEEKIALGYVQVNIISRYYTDEIAIRLRKSKFGVTILPAEGGSGGVSILVVIIRRKDLVKLKKHVEEIDSNVFMTVQHSRPFRGFIHGGRK